MVGRAVLSGCIIPRVALSKSSSRQIFQPPTVDAVCLRERARQRCARECDLRNPMSCKCHSPTHRVFSTPPIPATLQCESVVRSS